MAKTRSYDNIWLIGYSSETISGACLPSGKDALRNFMFYHQTNKLTIADSAKNVYENLMLFWLKSGIPVREKYHVVTMIKDLYQ